MNRAIDLPKDKIAEFCWAHHIRRLAFFWARHCAPISAQTGTLTFSSSSNRGIFGVFSA